MTVSARVPDIDEVDAVVDGEVVSMASGDIERYLSLLTDDAVFLPPGSRAKEGEELRDWLREFLRDFTVEWLAFSHDETAADAELAYHRYSYTWRVTSKTTAASTVAHGKGLHVLRREPDGNWRIAREIWNARPDPSEDGH